jgi:hypothetical protein
MTLLLTCQNSTQKKLALPESDPPGVLNRKGPESTQISQIPGEELKNPGIYRTRSNHKEGR